MNKIMCHVNYSHLTIKRGFILGDGERECVSAIGVGRFRILGGGVQGGPNSQQAHDVVTTSMWRNDVKVFNKSVPNNYISHLKI